MLNWLANLRNTQQISDISYHFTQLMLRLAKCHDRDLAMSIVLLSQAQQTGNVCLDLNEYAGKLAPLIAEAESWRLPPLPVWQHKLRESIVVGYPGEYKPLILEQTLLYLQRYWHYESSIANVLLTKAKRSLTEVDAKVLSDSLHRLFTTVNITSVSDLQQDVVKLGILRQFCIISGGPGTGKTTTIAKLIVALLEQPRHSAKPLRIVLSAPTGKAAARLQESFSLAKEKLKITDTIHTQLPQQAVTLHRLLGISHNNMTCRFHAGNRLPVDVIVIDEASMVDLLLLYRLLQALPEHARLLLVGDKDQLTSVEAGSVFGDICNASSKNSTLHAPEYKLHHFGGDTQANPLSSCRVLLEQNYRFTENSHIHQFAQAIVRADQVKAWQLLRDSSNDLVWFKSPQNPYEYQNFIDTLWAAYSRYWQVVNHSVDVEQVFAAFEECRVLCALRNGLYGVEEINKALLSQLQRQQGMTIKQDWYVGRPVMILKNDYTQKLFNGDIGITWYQLDAPSELRVYFRNSDGQLSGFSPCNLPPHETVYAMTIHKSQGSEFDTVFIVLPTEPVPLLTRELLYTAVTRARKSVRLWANETAISSALTRTVKRTSGLAYKLLKNGSVSRGDSA